MFDLKKKFILPISIFIGFTSFASAQNPQTKYKDLDPYNWKTAAPETQGLDPICLTHTMRAADKSLFLQSVLIVKNGFLVAESYFRGYDKYTADSICSASKSILSALIGIAIEENAIPNVQGKIMDYFPEYISADLDPRKFEITLKHLLTMTSGMSYEDDSEFCYGDDWIKICIEQPLLADPGAFFIYATSGTHILSAVLTKSTNMGAHDFAQTYLFDSLGITLPAWDTDPQGYNTGGWQMYLTPRDMARFGHLYLNNGSIQGNQIVPLRWVKKSLQPHSFTDWDYIAFKEKGYGYLWYNGWIMDHECSFALGHGGQIILLVPDLDMVVVTTANWHVSNSTSWKQIKQILDFFTNYIFSALRDTATPGPHPPSTVDCQTVKNNGLFNYEYINVLRWQPHPQNSGNEIQKYRIYIMKNGKKTLLSEASSEMREYLVRGISPEVSVTYGVTCVMRDGRESLPAVISIW